MTPSVWAHSRSQWWHIWSLYSTVAIASGVHSQPWSVDWRGEASYQSMPRTSPQVGYITAQFRQWSFTPTYNADDPNFFGRYPHDSMIQRYHIFEKPQTGILPKAEKGVLPTLSDALDFCKHVFKTYPVDICTEKTRQQILLIHTEFILWTLHAHACIQLQ